MTKHIEEELGWFERVCDKLHLLATTEENKKPMLVLVEKALTHLALQIHTDAIKELEGISNTLYERHSFVTESVAVGYNQALDEAITYHQKEIKRLTK